MTTAEARARLSYEGDVFHAEVADASPAYIWLLNPQGRIVHVGRAARRLQPKAPPPHVMPWRDAWPADCRFSIDRGIAEAKAGRSFVFRSRFITPDLPDGLYLATTVSAIRDGAGEIIRLLVKAEDVTSETEKAAFLNTVIDVLPLALTVKDARTGRYILGNRSADDLFDQEDGLVGLRSEDVLPPAFAAWSADASPGMGSQTAVHELPGPNAPRRLFATKVATYDDEGVRHLIGLSQDITQQQNDADALRRALQQAKQAGEARNAFVSNISHEIRTPLNGVMAGVELLKLGAESTDLDEVAAMIRASAAQLQIRFEQLLAISQLDVSAECGVAVPFDLRDFVADLVAPHRTAAQAKSLILSVQIADDLAASLIGDVANLERALTPLLENAVKFTDQGEVRLIVEAGAGDQVRFSCLDTGVGLTSDEKETLFAAFHQRDEALTRRFGGMGLGLALARKHACAIGGTIDACPRPDGGAVFWLDAPLATAPDSQAVDDRPLKVLVVDDHPTNRRIVEMMLDGVATVTSAQDGLEAVEAACNERFDLIFMDIQMPNMDGITATARIREAERTAGHAPVCIVMLTANTQPQHIAASRAAGADRHLGKPFTTAALLAEIQALSAD